MPQPVVLRGGDRDFRVVFGRDGEVTVDDGPAVIVRSRADATIQLADGTRGWAAASGDVRWVFIDGEVYEFELQHAGRGRRAGAHHESLSAPMPATVIRIHTPAGQAVKRGDTLIILEAMKMELPLRAPADGIVAAVHCREGELVQPGASLIELDE